MKVKITFTLEVDPDKWALEYGVDRSEVREDVKSYFSGSDLIPDHLSEDNTVIMV